MIFVVEDDANIQALISSTLRAGGYESRILGDAEAFYRALEEEIPSLLLLDIMLPGESGLDILRRVRAKAEYQALPVLLLTAKSEELDKVAGLDAGADDYITKPFSVLELLSRIRAALRRTELLRQAGEHVLPYKDLEIDTGSKEVRKAGEAIPFTYKEYELFLMLYRNRGMVLSREQLLSGIWGYDYDGGSRTVDVHVNSLRQKLGDSAENPRYIATLRGHGYKLLKE
ncbi:MAG: winged helix-turn-helix domain-containing protein [Oscillospiraceae bacterium]